MNKKQKRIEMEKFREETVQSMVNGKELLPPFVLKMMIDSKKYELSGKLGKFWLRIKENLSIYIFKLIILFDILIVILYVLDIFGFFN